MANVMAGELVDGLFDFSQSSVVSHFLGRKIGMGAGAIPVTLYKETTKMN